MNLALALYLGPARVLQGPGRPGYVQVARPDAEVLWARLALATPYSPAVGDEVLVICEDPEQAYVIGVLQGSGATAWRVPGDLRLEAPNGRVRISAGRGIDLAAEESIDLAAPRGTIRFVRLNILVTTLVQRLHNGFAWATGLLQTKSRRARAITEEGWLLRADRAHVKTTENVHINGKTIHLG
jgi:hypothetical protein